VEYHLESWPSITGQLLLIPGKFYNYIKLLMVKVADNYVRKDIWPVIFYWTGVLFILLAAFALNRLLRMVIQDKERSRLSAHLYDGVLSLLHRNMPHLALLVIIILTVYFNHVPFANYQLLVNLILVWLTFRNFILVARLILLERVSDSSGHDVKLYYRLRWLLLAGGWTTALMVFSHQLPLPLLLQDIFSRLFMLFLLAISWVIWRSKDVIPYLLQPLLITKKRYFQNAISLMTVLVPLVLLTTAMIGLVGYINLAWTLSRYQAYLLLLITAYILARGLVFDVLELLSEWMISSLENGWLWIEVFLKPFDKILRVLLLLISIIVLFKLFDWYSDEFVMGSLHEFGRYPLVDISGVHISLISIIEFFFLFCFFVWASKWTREFGYRWLYRNARDVGIRNSLSVFTQYAVIIIGVFITLRVLGLDFSGMSMVIGGLAVGMGFGLRDFASNIIGGIMLLIERPVREGDLITVGEYEGRVAHIGIRAIRVSSWDNMEVLIPNAETFSKPFTNWTHQDSVVRTVIPIKVTRSEDPILIQQLILDVLAIVPEILVDPPTQVFLKQIDEALIEFEVRYFINVQLYTRFEVRSKVLFAIMSQFKAAGVKAPIPPLSVEIKESDRDQPIKPGTFDEPD
jgi:potassium efflux system protein